MKYELNSPGSATRVLTNAAERPLGGKLLELGRNCSRGIVTVTADDRGNEAGDVGGCLHRLRAQSAKTTATCIILRRTIEVPEMLLVA